MVRLILSTIGILVLLFMTPAAGAQSRFPSQPAASDSVAPGPGDTLRSAIAVIDTLSSARPDTLAPIHPLRSVGSLSPASVPLPGPDSRGILWNDYRTFTDLLSGVPGVFVLDMGSPGQDNRVTVYGAGHSATAFLVDGIGQNDPVTGSYNFAFFPVEAIDRIEIVTGPRAFLYGENAAGGTVNVITKSFTNNKPYTHIRYSQSGDSYAQTDAMFSQNILARCNLAFGLSYLGYGSDRRSDLNKGRFPNADNEAYSFRTKVRYNVSAALNLVFTHFFNRTQTGLNGGINVAATDPAYVYDENAATVVNLDAYEKRFNHHAAATAVYRPPGDTALSASLSAYGSHELREYRDEENRAYPNGIYRADDFESTVLGVRGQFEWEFGGNLLSAIGETKQTRFERSVYGPAFTRPSRSLSLKDELTIAGGLALAVYTKIENGQETSAENAGADASLRLPGLFTLTAGASIARRHPTIPEAYLAGGAADSTIQKMLGSSAILPALSQAAMPADERHTVAEAGIRFTPIDNLSAGVTAARRRIEHWADRTLIKVFQTRTITVDVLTASVRLRSGKFYLDADAAYTRQTEILRNTTAIRLYPEWRGQGSVYFRGLLANGNLDLKAGVKGSFMSAFDGEHDRIADGVPDPIVDRQIGNAGTVDLFVIAHIGDAYIHVLWDNLTNSQYMLTPFYPMYDRTLRFGVSWEFLD